MRIDGVVYLLRAVRMEDESELEAARSAPVAKYRVEPDADAARACIFRLDPR